MRAKPAVRLRPGLATVHPPRGDDNAYWPMKSSLVGSPPRAWGRLRQADRSPVVIRFTPTRVGTTQAA